MRHGESAVLLDEFRDPAGVRETDDRLSNRGSLETYERVGIFARSEGEDVRCGEVVGGLRNCAGEADLLCETGCPRATFKLCYVRRPPAAYPREMRVGASAADRCGQLQEQISALAMIYRPASDDEKGVGGYAQLLEHLLARPFRPNLLDRN